jgi:amidohydrolase
MTDHDIIRLRHELHRYPELSGHEHGTAEKITEFIGALHPDEVMHIGKTGRAFIFSGTRAGKTLMFRAELDALPVASLVKAGHKSSIPGISHACGHDGHMAILAGLAKRIAAQRPEAGRVILLFQPAEETGQGAYELLQDENFKSIAPDSIFALHNIPGEEKNTVLLKEGHFAAASQGLIIRLEGKTSHAAEPENGKSPAKAIASLITQLNEISENKNLFRAMALLTIIHIRLGEVAFGTSPGNALMMVTMRAERDDDMNRMAAMVEERVNAISWENGLKLALDKTEVFPALFNDPECVTQAGMAAQRLGSGIKYLSSPFRWSEDFAYFTRNYKGCLIGLGAGPDHAQLHNPEYDFPDDIIDTGINLFYSIYKSYNFEDE